MINPRVGIIGAGIVGGTVAAQFHNAGIDTTVMDTNAKLTRKISDSGLRLISAMELQTTPITAYPSTKAALEDGKRFDVVFVSVKEPFNRHVVGDAASLLARGGMAVSFQNGIDTEQELLEAVGADQTLRGVCNYAGGPVPDDLGALNVVFNHPPNHMGAAVAGNESAIAGAHRVADLMNTAGLETVFADSIASPVWRKTIMNAAMTPLAAVMDMTMKEVMTNEYTRGIVITLTTEAMRVAQALGIDLGEDYETYAIGYLDKAGPHYPSMWYDFKNQVLSEIYVLNMAIAKHGTAVGVATPYNTMIARMVRAKETSYKQA